MVTQEKINRILWQSRRGMLELDLILVPFVRDHYPQLSPDDQRKYEVLLTCEDQDLFAWFMQKDSPESDELKEIVRLILDTRPQV